MPISHKEEITSISYSYSVFRSITDSQTLSLYLTVFSYDTQILSLYLTVFSYDTQILSLYFIVFSYDVSQILSLNLTVSSYDVSWLYQEQSIRISDKRHGGKSSCALWATSQQTSQYRQVRGNR